MWHRKLYGGEKSKRSRFSGFPALINGSEISAVRLLDCLHTCCSLGIFCFHFFMKLNLENA